MATSVFSISQASIASPEETAEFRLGHRPAIDGLRAISILLVLILHVNFLAPINFLEGGFIGVDIFFVISGFLITSLLIDEHAATGSVSLKSFYIRRGLRLLPALVAVLIFTCFIALLAGSFERLGMTPLRLTSTIFYFSNWVRAFESPREAWFLVHFWSLSIEEQFYLLWPLVLMLSLRIGRRFTLTLVVGGIVGSALLKAILFLSGTSTMRLYHGSDTRADALLVGCLLSLALSWRLLPAIIQRHSRLLNILSWLVIGATALFIVRDSSVLYLGGFTTVAIAAALIVLRSVNAPSSLLTNKLSIWIGKRSYGLYLWHWPVYLLARTFPEPYVVPIAVIATFVFAAISFRYVEQPFLRMKTRFARS